MRLVSAIGALVATAAVAVAQDASAADVEVIRNQLINIVGATTTADDAVRSFTGPEDSANLQATVQGAIYALSSGASAIEPIQGFVTIAQAATQLFDQVDAMNTVVEQVVTNLQNQESLIVSSCLGPTVLQSLTQILEAANNFRDVSVSKFSPENRPLILSVTQPPIDSLNQGIAAYSDQNSLPASCETNPSPTSAVTSSISSTVSASSSDYGSSSSIVSSGIVSSSIVSSGIVSSGIVSSGIVSSGIVSPDSTAVVASSSRAANSDLTSTSTSTVAISSSVIASSGASSTSTTLSVLFTSTGSNTVSDTISSSPSGTEVASSIVLVSRSVSATDSAPPVVSTSSSASVTNSKIPAASASITGSISAEGSYTTAGSFVATGSASKMTSSKIWGTAHLPSTRKLEKPRTTTTTTICTSEVCTYKMSHTTSVCSAGPCTLRMPAISLACSAGACTSARSTTTMAVTNTLLVCSAGVCTTQLPSITATTYCTDDVCMIEVPPASTAACSSPGACEATTPVRPAKYTGGAEVAFSASSLLAILGVAMVLVV